MFDYDAFLRQRLYADDLHNSGSNEFIAGFERQLAQDLSLSATYTYQKLLRSDLRSIRSESAQPIMFLQATSQPIRCSAASPCRFSRIQEITMAR